MKNRVALIIGGVVVFVILLAIIGGSGSNNNPTRTTSNNNQPSLCSDITSLKDQATTVNFKELDKNPDSFKGEIVKLTGQVIQIQEADNYGIIRLAVTKESYGWSISDIVYVEYQNHTDAVKDDIVTVYGQLTGSKTYESQAHFNITVPSMTACVVEKGIGTTATQTPPATQPATPKTTNTNQPQTQTQTTPKPATPTTPALSVSCSALQISLTTGQSAIWSAQASGGTSPYTYSWSGTDGLSGDTQTVTKSYANAGTKNASVDIVSGDQSVNQSCNNSVLVSIPVPIPSQTNDQNISPVSSETISQTNAVKKAKSYLDYTAFSRDGLVAQLEYEQFSHADAVYGADNSGANWDEQAAKKAKSYMEYSAFSHGSLIAQLEYDKFTQEQAEYGANAVGL